MKHEIFSRMHEKMTPSEKTVDELFARAAALSDEENTPSEDPNGGITMSMNKNIRDEHNGYETSVVKSRKAGIAVSIAAVLAVAVGVGAFSLHKGGLDTEEVSSAASQVQEDTASDTASEAPADTADDSGRSVSVEEAKARVSFMELVKAGTQDLEAFITEDLTVIGEPEIEIDSGVECYVFSDVKGTTYYVPTGRVEKTDEPDTFMTELAAGQALTDAGIAHTGFDVLGVTPDRVNADGKETIDGVKIDFVADALLYSYFIDNMSVIKSSSCCDATRYSHILTEDEARDVASDLLGVPVDKIDFKTADTETDYNIKSYVFTCDHADNKNVTVIVPTGEIVIKPEEEFDSFMTETAAGMALTDAGVAHRDLRALSTQEGKTTDAANKEHSGWIIQFLARDGLYRYFIDDTGAIVEKDKFDVPAEGAYENIRPDYPDSTDNIERHSYEEYAKIIAKEKGYDAERIEILNIGIDNYADKPIYAVDYRYDPDDAVAGEQRFYIDEDMQPLGDDIVTSNVAFDRAVEFVNGHVTAYDGDEKNGPKWSGDPEYEVDGGIECYIVPLEQITVGKEQGSGAKFEVIIPTGKTVGNTDEPDLFMTETAAGIALTEAGVAHDEFSALVSFEADETKHNGWRIMFEADSMLYTYTVDEMGEVVQKKVLNPYAGTALTETDIAEYEARRMVLADAGYKLADANSFGSVRGTGTDGVDGWIFDFSAGGKDYKYVVSWDASAKDKAGRYTILEKTKL